MLACGAGEDPACRWAVWDVRGRAGQSQVAWTWGQQAPQFQSQVASHAWTGWRGPGGLSSVGQGGRDREGVVQDPAREM